MDTLTHALVGNMVAGLTGHSLSLHDPVYLAIAIGAQSPDFDLIAQIRGKFSYLRQHRSFSHSLPGVIMWSSLIAFAIHIFFPNTSSIALFGWSLLGCLSHVITDYFNTHGVAIFWPKNKCRQSCCILNVFDPLLLFLLSLPFFLPVSTFTFSLISLFIICGYIIFRVYLRHRSTRWLLAKFSSFSIINITVMPSLTRIFFWDFVLETSEHYWVGKIGALCPLLEVQAKLPKPTTLTETTFEAQNTPLGEFFNTFTPHIYFAESRDLNTLTVTIYDLRYYINQEFLHRATIVFNNDNLPIASYMNSSGDRIFMDCTAVNKRVTI